MDREMQNREKGWETHTQRGTQAGRKAARSTEYRYTHTKVESKTVRLTDRLKAVKS